MDDRLTQFLRYDYAEAKDMAKAFLTVAAVLLGAGIAFAEKFVRLHETDRLAILRIGMVGLYALAGATIMSALALLLDYESMLRILHRYDGGIRDPVRFAADVRSHNLGIDLCFMAAGAFVMGGLLCLVKGAFDNSPASRHAEATSTVDDESA